MRSDKEMFDLILDIAKGDDRIRAVYMNGSRTNPNAILDIFQDYDIVYVVKVFIWRNKYGTNKTVNRSSCHRWKVKDN